MDWQLARFSLSSLHIYIHPPVLPLVYDLCALRCTQSPLLTRTLFHFTQTGTVPDQDTRTLKTCIEFVALLKHARMHLSNPWRQKPHPRLCNHDRLPDPASLRNHYFSPTHVDWTQP